MFSLERLAGPEYTALCYPDDSTQQYMLESTNISLIFRRNSIGDARCLGGRQQKPIDNGLDVAPSEIAPDTLTYILRKPVEWQFCRSTSCRTRSKALSISKLTARPSPLLSIAAERRAAVG